MKSCRRLQAAPVRPAGCMGLRRGWSAGRYRWAGRGGSRLLIVACGRPAGVGANDRIQAREQYRRPAPRRGL
jgi:hypothetical protein